MFMSSVSIKSVDFLGLNRTISLGDVIDGKKIGYITFNDPNSNMNHNMIAYGERVEFVTTSKNGITTMRTSKFYGNKIIAKISNCSNYIVTKEDTNKLIQDGLLVVDADKRFMDTIDAILNRNAVD
jgi:hypothetical protein